VATISILFGRILSSDRELHLPDHGLQLVERDRVSLPHVHRRQGRVVLGRQAEEPELRGSGLDEHRVVFLQCEMDLFVRHRADDVEQPFRFDRDPTRGGDAGGGRAEDRDVEVGGGNLQPSVGSAEQDIRKNRYRRTLLDDPLAKLEFFLKIRFSDGQLHVVSSFKTNLYLL
jgi:hypothetical protein